MEASPCPTSTRGKDITGASVNSKIINTRGRRPNRIHTVAGLITIHGEVLLKEVASAEIAKANEEATMVGDGEAEVGEEDSEEAALRIIIKGSITITR